MLVDCDIHLGYDALTDLLPHLDAPTRELVLHSGSHGLSMPTYAWNHPTGWIRRDLYADEDGGYSSDFVVGISLETLREKHLDRYGVDVGIVEPDEAAVFSLLPNAQLAAKLCTAYNDFLLERWLQEERRLRGMLGIADLHVRSLRNGREVVLHEAPPDACRAFERCAALGGREEALRVEAVVDLDDEPHRRQSRRIVRLRRRIGRRRIVFSIRHVAVLPNRGSAAPD